MCTYIGDFVSSKRWKKKCSPSTWRRVWLRTAFRHSCLWPWWCETHVTLPSFLVHVTGVTLCPDFLVLLFHWLWLKTKQLCTFSEFLQCAPCDDWTSLGPSLFSFIILTRLVSIDPEKRIVKSFLGSCLVFLVILVTYGLHRKNTFTSTKWQRSRLTRILSRTRSHWTSIVQRFNNTDYWKWGRFHWHPKFRKKRF